MMHWYHFGLHGASTAASHRGAPNRRAYGAVYHPRRLGHRPHRSLQCRGATPEGRGGFCSRGRGGGGADGPFARGPRPGLVHGPQKLCDKDLCPGNHQIVGVLSKDSNAKVQIHCGENIAVFGGKPIRRRGGSIIPPPPPLVSANSCHRRAGRPVAPPPTAADALPGGG